jgi:hypothetical protein
MHPIFMRELAVGRVSEMRAMAGKGRLARQARRRVPPERPRLPTRERPGRPAAEQQPSTPVPVVALSPQGSGHVLP